MRVLILGGYGTFGKNIAALLKDDSGLVFILAGRNLHKAQAACEALSGGGADFYPALIDRSQDLSRQIDHPPDVIIDATGPFQSFKGAARNIVIDYALKTGAHYLDLSDDTDFIRHIENYDAAAKAAQITALSGLSTYPVLGAAAAQHLRAYIPAPQTLTTGIAPSPQAQLGRNVLAAILNSAGRKTVYERRGGQPRKTRGLLQRDHRTIAPPLARPMKPLLWLQVDSPEALFLSGFDSLRQVQNFAAPQPVWIVRVLNRLSWLARFRLLPPLRFFTPLFHKLHQLLSYGEHRSGYFLALEDDDRRAEFHLTAKGDHGPLIPSMPAAIIIRKLQSGAALETGARHAAAAVSFDDYADMFRPLDIHYGVHETIKTPRSPRRVYRRFLGQAFEDLPPHIQSLHEIDREKTYHGRAHITRGRNPLGHVICAVFGFPKAGQDIPVSIRQTPLGNGRELWERRFNGRVMRSTQDAGTGQEQHMMIERFGPIAVTIAYYKEGDIYRLETRGWRVFGVPMPAWLRPYGDVYERAEDDRFHFHVELCVPLIGQLVTYVGWFDPKPQIRGED